MRMNGKLTESAALKSKFGNVRPAVGGLIQIIDYMQEMAS